MTPPGPYTRIDKFIHRLLRACTALCLAALPVSAQTPPPTGPQTLTLSALRAGPNPQNPQSQINAIAMSPVGNLYLLVDQKDGIRLLETDPTATNILAQAQLGASGDIGVALTLDPTGNIYITGTSTSGTLSATSGVAFPTPTGTATNGFVAKFNPTLHPIFLTFTGASPMSAQSIAATADAVFLAGLIFTPSLPTTPNALVPSPAPNTPQNGFVEKFSSDGTHLLYATYLTAANGTTSPTAIAADTSDNAYIAGSTSSPAYPTTPNALIPQILSPTSGFLTKLTPLGDALVFSTYIPGTGLTSLTLNPTANNLLLSGDISPGQFPITNVTQPLTPLPYQSLLRISLDGSTVLSSTLLAPGTQSFVTPTPSGSAWITGDLTLPLLPQTPLSDIGTTFAAHVTSTGVIDQTTRLGGIPTSNPNYASAPILLTSLATDAAGNPTFAGAFQPTASQNLLPTQTFDVSVTTPTPAFPGGPHSAVLPPSACQGSLCPGSASYLAQLSTSASAQPSLALSLDDSPNLTLRNLGSAPATNLQLTTTGFTNTTNCATSSPAGTLPAGAECSIALTGPGPGTITLTATNATTQTHPLPALTNTPLPIVFSPKELDFGIVSSANPTPITRTVTVTNLTQQPQTFLSHLDTTSTPPYTLAETTSDCTPAGPQLKLLLPGNSCHITLGLTASASPSADAPIHANWLIGTRDVQLTAYTQAAALALSSPEIDFGTQYPTTPPLPRYLYLSNSSTTSVPHTPLTLPGTSPFTLTDNCPTLLLPFTVCQLTLTYLSPHSPSTDTTTLTLDQNLTALITGTTLPAPTAAGPAPLTLSPPSISFPTPVPVTSTSTTPQALTVTNTGTTSIPITISQTGDFTHTSTCTSTIVPNSSCSINLTFTPSQPGSRTGLLTITTPTSSQFVPITGTATPILSPANNGTLDFGAVFIGQPSILWIKITQPFPTISINTTSSNSAAPFLATLVEDTGFGHGQPPASTFSAHPSGTCFNCWLGVRFTPLAIGPETGSLTLTSTGSPYVLALAGTGLPTTGLLLTPVAADFGPIPVHSSSSPTLFTLTSLNTTTSIPITAPILTGDFALTNTPSGGPTCTTQLAYNASCFLEIAFTPTAPGPRTGTLTFQAGSLTLSTQLTGYGAPDTGLAIQPAALIFNNVPGPTATRQTITLTNTSSAPEQIGSPTLNSASFTVSSTCSTLAPGTSCTLTVNFTPDTTTPSTTISLPVTSTGNVIVYTIQITGAYTTQTAGLQIIPNDTQFAPQPLYSLSPTRQLTLNNLTSKSLTLSFAPPRQFPLTSAPCASLAPFASCTFSAAFLPIATADATGSLFVTGTPTDGSPNLTGIAYFEAYGTNPGTNLSITGPGLQPDGVLDFGQLSSGQTTQRTLTLTNTPAFPYPITIRRITSPWPFLATSSCLTSIQLPATCTITLTYAPLNQVYPGSSPSPATPDLSTLTIESDAASSPDLIHLTGTSTPTIASTPSNNPLQAILTPSQGSLTFGPTALAATSLAQTILLTNTGTVPLTLAIPQTPEFPITSNCSNLAPSESCILHITFKPLSTTSTNHIDSIKISSNASTPLDFISLLGFTGASTLALNPSSLNFGTQLLGASVTLPAQLTNTGSLPATILTFTPTSGYTVLPGTCPTAGTQLPPNATCTLNLTFTPTQTGTLPGTLTITSSDPTLTVPLTGIGAPPPTFTLTANGASSASSTVTSGSSATYALLATPLNGFTGPLTLTCTAILPAPHATCTIQPANFTLASTPQTATATIVTTAPTAAQVTPHPALPGLAGIATCFLLPTLIFASTRRTLSRYCTLALISLATLSLISFTACGNIITPYLTPALTQPGTPAGAYIYQVTATSTATVTPITQTVTLNLTVR